MTTLLLVSQGEESRGYQELVAAAKRVDSVPVAVCSDKEVWAEYGVSSDTIALFRKVRHALLSSRFWQRRAFFQQRTRRVFLFTLMQADEHQENLVVEKAKKLDADGLVNFITTNEVRYLTEYGQVVGQALLFIVIN